MPTDMHETIDRLLHDAEHADSGASFAAVMARTFAADPAHAQAAQELAEKRDALMAEALRLDPERTAPAWQETTLDTGEEQADG